MVDFWSHSGWHLLNSDEAGDLAVTPAFVRAYFLRPEVRPRDVPRPLVGHLRGLGDLPDAPVRMLREHASDCLDLVVW